MSHRLAEPPRLLRIGNTKGRAFADGNENVDPQQGDFGAGVIRGAAVITRGEALGHEFWVDSEMVLQVFEALRDSPNGVKSRFAHPTLSGDGIGKVLGRFKASGLEGDIARGDLHFFRTAHNAPDGDLAEYTMSLAAEDGTVFGTSIVFEPDVGAEEQFWAENLDSDGNFVSPDPANEKNLRHARLKKLWAVDVVDDPAANPGGMFSRGQELAYEANALLEYALGMSDSPPLVEELGIDPTRVRHFWKRFLDTHDNVVVNIHKEPHMAGTATKSDALSVQVDADALRADGAKSERERFAALQSAFSSDPAFVAEQFAAGNTVEQAQPLWLSREIDRLRAENAALKAKLEDEEEKPEDEELECEEDEEEMEEGEEKPEEELRRGASPVPFGAGSGKALDFLSAAKAYAAEKKCSIGDAQSHIAKTQPELFAAYKASLRLL